MLTITLIVTYFAYKRILTHKRARKVYVKWALLGMKMGQFGYENGPIFLINNGCNILRFNDGFDVINNPNYS